MTWSTTPESPFDVPVGPFAWSCANCGITVVVDTRATDVVVARGFVVVVVDSVVVVFTVVAGAGTYDTVGLVSGVSCGSVVVVGAADVGVVVSTVVVVGGSACAVADVTSADKATAKIVAPALKAARRNCILKGSAGEAAP
jgi:hypothetical protein